MPLTDVVTIRLPAGKRFLYEKEAANKAQSLGVYLRECLEQGEAISHQSIRASSSHEQGVLLEILLLLRYTVGTEKLYLVRKELDRLNIPSWKMDSLPGKPKHANG